MHCQRMREYGHAMMAQRLRIHSGRAWLVHPHVLSLSCLLCGVASRGRAQDGAPAAGEAGLGHWMTGAPAPTARTEVAVAALDGLIYVVGGFEQASSWRSLQSSASTKVEVYDPVTNRWSSRPDLPMGLHHAGAAVLDGALYVVGGFAVSDDTLWIHPDGCSGSIRLMKHGPNGLRCPRLVGDWP